MLLRSRQFPALEQVKIPSGGGEGWIAACGWNRTAKAGGNGLKVEATGTNWMPKRTNPFTFGERVVYEKVAATYFPAFYCSIIGAKGLNFSVRDGKRWTPSLKPPSMSSWRMGWEEAFYWAIEECFLRLARPRRGLHAAGESYG